MKYFTPEQTQTINDYQVLIRLWAKAEILPQNMTQTQLHILKNFVKKDINWQLLTGSK